MTAQPSDGPTPARRRRKAQDKPKAANTPVRVVNAQRAAKPGSTTGTPKRVMLGVADRRAKAVEMYLAQVDLVAIGRTLSRQRGTPYGYDGDADDRSLAATVSKDITRAMEARARHPDGDVKAKRADAVATHRRIIAALMPRVLAGDPAAASAANAHLARIARLEGLDEPTKVAVSSSDPAVRAAVDEIMGLIGVSDEQEPTEPSP